MRKLFFITGLFLFSLPGYSREQVSGGDTLNIQYRITRKDIGEKEFTATYRKYHRKDTLRKITDAREAITLLKDRIAFEKVNDTDYRITALKFTNGKEHTYGEYEDAFFIAYYPDEQILLLEGGHASDVLFDLNTGAETAVPRYPAGNKNTARRKLCRIKRNQGLWRFAGISGEYI